MTGRDVARLGYRFRSHNSPPIGATIAVSTCLLLLAVSARAAEVYRFLDNTTAPVTSLAIDGLSKRVLNPFRTQEIFALPAQNGASVLSFAVGQQPTAAPGTVRFIVERDLGGTWAPLYQKDLSEPGWVDERITLPADSGALRLRLRRQLMAGGRERAEKSAFGDPVLLPAELPKRPSVILISLDTLRADRLGLAGQKHARTPVLDAFGKSGIWYFDAYSPSAWTLPSHASLLYGLPLPMVPERPLGTPTKPVPHADALSIAEILRAAGYLTAGFTGGGYLSSGFAFNRGFDSYFSFPQTKEDKAACAPQRFDGPAVFARGTKWLRDRGAAPFFLFVHTYDVHDRCPFQRTTIGHDDVPWDTLDEAGNKRLLAYYDDLIAETDTRVGMFLKELDALGKSNDTLVVITSDHGELFNEHGLRGHGCTNTLFDPLIRVPLLIRYPARLEPRAPGRNPVALVDVAPTILKLLGIPQPAAMSGQPLPGLGTRDEDARPVLTFCDSAVAIRDGNLKVIVPKAGDAPRMYDLGSDPTEQRDVFTTRKQEVAPLLDQARQYWDTTASQIAKQPTREVDAETRERLRALGYNP